MTLATAGGTQNRKSERMRVEITIAPERGQEQTEMGLAAGAYRKPASLFESRSGQASLWGISFNTMPDIDPLQIVAEPFRLNKKCFYCGRYNKQIVSKEKSFRKAIRKTGRIPKRPICERCLQDFYANPLMVSDDGLEMRIRSHLLEIEQKAELFNQNTSIEKVNELVREVSRVYKFKTYLEDQFAKASERAQSYADAIIQFDKRISGVDAAIRGKTRLTYDYRRNTASVTISNPEVRSRIFTRDGFKCKKCGATDSLSIDHIISVFLGGNDDDVNLQCLCVSCNSSKGAS